MDSRIISVFSNKGGVGKTFFAVNLATALAVSGRRVLLLDFDIQAGDDMARMLGVTPKQSLVQLFKEDQNPGSFTANSVRKFVISHSSGLDFLPAILTPQEISSLTAKDIKPFFKAAAQIYDYVVIDLGQSFSETMLGVLDQSSLILLLATPDILAVYQLRWCIKVLEDMHFPLKMVKLVLNRAESQGGVAWQEVRDALDIDIIGRIPSDGIGVGKALERGVPSVIDTPKSPVADAFRKIISELKKSDLYLQTTETDRSHTPTDKFEEPKEFWDQFSNDKKNEPESQEAIALKELLALKRRIQLRLISKLNLEALTPEHFTDPVKAQELKEAGKKIV
ncbi:MAG: P-loop NTPase, partial [Candidatus Omnitrophota bacterium]